MANCSQLLKTGGTTWHRTLRVSPRVKSLGAYVLGAGFATIPPHSPYPPYQRMAGYACATRGRTLPAYHFVYITRGAGIFASKSCHNEPVQAGDIFILSPQVWHRYHPSPKTGWSEYWIDFDGDYIRRLMAHKEFSKDEPVCCIGVQESILDLFLKAIELLKNKPTEYQLLLGALAAQTIVQVLSALKRQSHENRSDAAIIREAKRWLIHESTQSENLDDLASRLKISYSSFRKLFKAETGVSPHQFVLEVKMQKASNLLAGTEVALHLVAEQYGMEPGYFSRLFKKKIGLTPSAFRQLHQPPQ
jgi:AraC-like DNA-binding protein